MKPEALAELSKYPWRWDTPVVSIGAAGVRVIQQKCWFLVAGRPSCRVRRKACAERAGTVAGGIFEPRPVSTFIRQFERALFIE
jgi:hypothetical protein